jgi:diguanylate cyclase (GGDEF)-like protein
VRTESLTDPLTTLANRKFFDAELDRTVAEAKTGYEPLALLMCDVDHFKAFNDRFGHLTGDQVLRLVAVSVKQIVRGEDIAARYGGEEFAIILPETDRDGACEVAERIRHAVMGLKIAHGAPRAGVHVTLSVGVATQVPTSDVAPDSLLGQADQALYAAKRLGRNRVTSSDTMLADVAGFIAAKRAKRTAQR